MITVPPMSTSADTLERVTSEMQGRVAELRPLVEEHNRLEEALRALGAPVRRRPGRPKGSTNGRRKGRAANT